MPHPTAPDRTGATATIANPHSTPPPMTVILKKPQTGSVPLPLCLRFALRVQLLAQRVEGVL